jgi:hypothetical protein
MGQDHQPTRAAKTLPVNPAFLVSDVEEYCRLRWLGSL